MSCFSKAEQLIYFDIKDQNANQALINFAQQSQQTLLFSFELTAKAKSNPIKGYYSTDFALRKLLRNSGLTFSKNQDNIIAINANDSKAEQINVIATSHNNSAPAAELSIEKIAIVGSRTARRSIIDLPVPVDILSVQQLKPVSYTHLTLPTNREV